MTVSYDEYQIFKTSLIANRMHSESLHGRLPATYHLPATLR